jgi:hypothetical protein
MYWARNSFGQCDAELRWWRQGNIDVLPKHGLMRSGRGSFISRIGRQVRQLRGLEG